MFKKAILLVSLVATGATVGAPVPNAVVEKAGAERITVAVTTPPGPYTTSLKRNLQISGWFTLASAGTVKVVELPVIS